MNGAETGSTSAACQCATAATRDAAEAEPIATCGALRAQAAAFQVLADARGKLARADPRLAALDKQLAGLCARMAATRRAIAEAHARTLAGCNAKAAALLAACNDDAPDSMEASLARDLLALGGADGSPRGA